MQTDYQTGYEHGRAVPARPASREQAWSDWRSQRDIPRDDATRDEYVRGHMDGQESGQGDSDD